MSTDGITVMVFDGYSTSMEKQKFVCLRDRGRDHHCSEEEVKKWPFGIFNCEVRSNGRLIVRPFSAQRVEGLIKEGKLKGEIVKGDLLAGRPFDNVTVIWSAEELRGVIFREGTAAFVGEGENDTLVFTRGVAH